MNTKVKDSESEESKIEESESERDWTEFLQSCDYGYQYGEVYQYV